MASNAQAATKPDLQDLGFGSRVTQDDHARLLNRDGSFNVRRRGFSFLRSWSLYHLLLTMRWWQFGLFVILVYIGFNALFALAFMGFGPASLTGETLRGLGDRYLESFFFSVQTITTVGYGQIAPYSLAANLLGGRMNFSMSGLD